MIRFRITNIVQTLRVMAFRKDEHVDYKLTNLRSFHSILEILRRYMKVKEIWMVENGGSLSKTYDTEIDVYNVFSFHNFNEVMDKLSPNLVIGFGGNYEYLERSMIIAAAFKQIPTVTVLGSFIEPWVTTKGFVAGLISGRLHALRDHGKNIIRKYVFLLKTLSHAGYGSGYIFQTVVKDVYIPFTSFSPIYTFGGADLNIISTPQLASQIIKKGVDRKKIVVTGDCSMDAIHEKLKNNKQKAVNNKLLEMLFITSPMVEHGYWKPSMRKEVVSKVVKAISEQLRNKVNLRVKIHPKTEKLAVYKEIVLAINPGIEIIQTGDLLSIINNSDIIVSFGSSSALFEALLVGKPIFIMNIFNEDINRNVYLKENLAVECKTVESLVRNIEDKKNEFGRKRIDAFIEKTFYKFDGRCSERAAGAIISLLDKSSNH